MATLADLDALDAQEDGPVSLADFDALDAQDTPSLEQLLQSHPSRGFPLSAEEATRERAPLKEIPHPMTNRDIGDIVGPIAGGIFGAPGGAAGGALGAGLGKAGGRIIGTALDRPEPSVIEEANQIDVPYGEYAAAVGEGALEELLARTVMAPFSGIAKRFRTSAIPEAGKNVAEDLLRGAPTLGERASRAGYVGTQHGIFGQADEAAKQIGTKINQTLESVADRQIPIESVISRVNEPIQQMRQLGLTGKADAIEKRLFDFIDAHPSGSLTPIEANQLKTQFADVAEKMYRQPSLDPTGSAEAKFAQQMANGLRRSIEEVAPEIRGLNQEYHLAREVRNSMASEMAKRYTKTPALRSPFGDLRVNVPTWLRTGATSLPESMSMLPARQLSGIGMRDFFYNEE